MLLASQDGRTEIVRLLLHARAHTENAAGAASEAGLLLRKFYYPPTMENQMEKKMENEMETGGI